MNKEQFMTLSLLSGLIFKSSLGNYNQTLTTDNFKYLKNRQKKAILFPMSDLGKEIVINGERFTPIVVLASLFRLEMYQFVEGKFFSNNYGRFVSLGEMPFEFILKLIEWHFDVAGLIERNEAININNIENPYK